MSFAQKHMYKQGWVEGKGLGRNESGMKTAIKVKIKRDQAGIGHDMAEEFTFQWWDHVFNRWVFEDKPADVVMTNLAGIRARPRICY